MLEGIEINCHSSIKISKNKTIYIDPFKIEKESHDADLILITHSHYDHFSEEDITKIKNNNTIILATYDLEGKTLNLGFEEAKIIFVKPNERFEIDNIEIKTIPAYNINKAFHPKENNWVGYLIKMQDIAYYIAGDTDITDENKNVNCDIAFLPIGGTYTLDILEAVELAKIIKPKIVIPMHYGEIVGEKEAGIKFKEKIYPKINCEILIK